MREPQAGAARTAGGGSSGATAAHAPRSPRCVYWAAGSGDTSRTCRDVGLNCSYHGAWRSITDARVLGEHTIEVYVLRPGRRIGSADFIALVNGAVAA